MDESQKFWVVRCTQCAMNLGVANGSDEKAAIEVIRPRSKVHQTHLMEASETDGVGYTFENKCALFSILTCRPRGIPGRGR